MSSFPLYGDQKHVIAGLQHGSENNLTRNRTAQVPILAGAALFADLGDAINVYDYSSAKTRFVGVARATQARGTDGYTVNSQVNVLEMGFIWVRIAPAVINTIGDGLNAFVDMTTGLFTNDPTKQATSCIFRSSVVQGQYALVQVLPMLGQDLGGAVTPIPEPELIE